MQMLYGYDGDKWLYYMYMNLHVNIEQWTYMYF